MKDCWKILGIQPTGDLAVIRRNYLSLIKKYHPDLATNPEQERKYTIHSAEINSAYEEAKRLAQHIGFAVPHSPAKDVFQEPFKPWYSRYLSYGAGAIGILISLLVFGYLIPSLADSIHRLPETNFIRVIFDSLLVFVVSAMFFGFMVMGLVDIIIAFLFPFKLLEKYGLERLNNKLVFITILLVHIYIFYFTGLGNVFFRNGQMGDLYKEIGRFVACGTIPFVLMFNWIKDIVKYRRLKKRGPAIQTIDN